MKNEIPLNDDNTLISRIKNHEEEALAVMMQKYSAKVLSVAYGVLQQLEDAQDVMQDVFWALWRSPDNFNNERGSLATWLVIFTRSRAIDSRRLPYRHKEVMEELPTNISRCSFDDRKLLVEELLWRLPARHRKLMRKIYFQGYVMEEIAHASHRPLGTIKGRVRSALQKMRSEMGVAEK